MKHFVVEIVIKQKCWHYTSGQRLFIAIMSSTKYHARVKFTNKHWGSEYPTYEIIEIHDCDNKGLFNPNNR